MLCPNGPFLRNLIRNSLIRGLNPTKELFWTGPYGQWTFLNFGLICFRVVLPKLCCAIIEFALIHLTYVKTFRKWSKHINFRTQSIRPYNFTLQIITASIWMGSFNSCSERTQTILSTTLSRKTSVPLNRGPTLHINNRRPIRTTVFPNRIRKHTITTARCCRGKLAPFTAGIRVIVACRREFIANWNFRRSNYPSPRTSP